MVLFTILSSALLGFSALYAPQPLYPVFQISFNVTPTQVATLTTLTLLPMSVAPFFYGFLLEVFSPQRLLLLSLILLAFLQFSFIAFSPFWALQMIRLLSGLVLPALFTSLMTYVARLSDPDRRRRWMAYYIAATILGGMSGRLVSGAISHYFHWQVSFLILGCSMLFILYPVWRLPEEKGESNRAITWSSALRILANREVVFYYIAVSFSFLVFVAILNFLPFRIRELNPAASEFYIGLNYIGYTIGIVVAVNNQRLQRWFLHPAQGSSYAVFFMILVLVLLYLPMLWTLFLVMFVLAALFFFIHATASTCVNKLESGNHGLVNGLYVSFYYLGGSVGSLAPGPIYAQWGWSWVIAALQLLLLLVWIYSLVYLKSRKLRTQN